VIWWGGFNQGNPSGGVACELACLPGGSYLEANCAHSFSFPFPFPFPPYSKQQRGFLLIMHSRFIFLFLLHGVIANQELPLLSRTGNFFPPAPDLHLVPAVASMEPMSTAASLSASQAFEARDCDREYEHNHQTG